MEVPFEVLSIIGSQLSYQTLEALGTVSKSFAVGVHDSKKTVAFWKDTAEYLTGMTLPFTPIGDKQEYWKDLATSLQNAESRMGDSITELFRTGQYEFVYIGLLSQRLNANVNSKDIKKALKHASESDDVESISLLLKMRPQDVKINIEICLVSAVMYNSINVFRFLLDRPIVTQTVIRMPMLIAVSEGNAEILSLMLHKYPLDGNNCDILFTAINITTKNREGLLAVFVTSCSGMRGNLSKYCSKLNDLKMSGVEMTLIISSGLFVIDEVKRADILTPEAAYILYVRQDSESMYKNKLLQVIATNLHLLEQALVFGAPQSSLGLWDIAMTTPNTWHILLNHFTLSKKNAHTLVSKHIYSSFNIQAVVGICNHVGITIQDIEVIIAECTKVFKGSSVKNILKLGVPLRKSVGAKYIIGEKLAFNCAPIGWQALQDGGFDFNGCGTDLVKHTVDTNTIGTIKMLENFVTEYDTDAVHAKIMWMNLKSNDTMAVYFKAKMHAAKSNVIVPKFIHSVMSGDTKLSIRCLRDGVPWNIIFDFTYVDLSNKDEWLLRIRPELARHPKMKEGIAIMKKTVENIILRDYMNDRRAREKNFLSWLILARGLLSKVSYAELGDIKMFSVIIDGNTFEIGDKIPTGKYKGLDLFSTNGVLLTSKDAIRFRRDELQYE